MDKLYETYFGEGTVLIADGCSVVKDREGRVFVVGFPTEESKHSCNAMGCASFGPHVIGLLKE